MQSESIVLLCDTVKQPKQFLYNLRSNITRVYQSCMEEAKAGIVSAMLLGEKSLLDTEIKSLYQINGIGHILAISGLHITILCTLMYQLTFFMRFPRTLSFIITVIFLFGYGSMTGFGISTTRAVIMMLLTLHAREIGRSYDPPSAMAFSAICILLQKPYALFSCSFLLSYGAVAGVYLIYPILKILVLGSDEKQECRKRKRQRKEKEILANLKQMCLLYFSRKLILQLKNSISKIDSMSLLTQNKTKIEQRIHFILKKILRYILVFPKKIMESLLLSFSIWIATLPILLYFFYEFPTYGIFLNLIILPLVSVVVALSLLGGVIGLFCLPLADRILYVVSVILDFYELLCNLILCLPQPIQVFGRPSALQIICYYLILTILCLLVQYEKVFRILAPVLGITGILFLLYRPLPDGLKLTMLDVGQGDGIFLQTEDGTTLLIDGGSTSVSQVGKYRILPYLKYYGIRKVDYLLMTHSDEDHISGQQELMESCQVSGVEIGCYLVPDLPEEARDSNYQQMIATAQRANIPVYFINASDALSFDTLQLVCLHPAKDFNGSSANSYSVTLSLSYGNFSMLLTGDLEAEGEDVVFQRLQKKEDIFSYTVLKVAHHGSKNSTSEEFLKLVKPKVALISCGENNFYGHPHKETLERLEQAGSSVMVTTEYGAITIEVEEEVKIYGFKNERQYN